MTVSDTSLDVGGTRLFTRKRTPPNVLLAITRTDDKRPAVAIPTGGSGSHAPEEVVYVLGKLYESDAAVYVGHAGFSADHGVFRDRYEEYHPYGSTAWHAFDESKEVSAKRYRYTGMERDDETGLQYHSARYYAPWLGRWTSADPSGLADGANRFSYCRGDPVGHTDSMGGEGESTESLELMRELESQFNVRFDSAAALQNMAEEDSYEDPDAPEDYARMVHTRPWTYAEVQGVGMALAATDAQGLLGDLTSADDPLVIGRLDVAITYDNLGRAKEWEGVLGRYAAGQSTFVLFDEWSADAAVDVSPFGFAKTPVHELFHAATVPEGTVEQLIGDTKASAVVGAYTSNVAGYRVLEEIATGSADPQSRQVRREVKRGQRAADRLSSYAGSEYRKAHKAATDTETGSALRLALVRASALEDMAETYQRVALGVPSGRAVQERYAALDASIAVLRGYSRR